MNTLAAGVAVVVGGGVGALSGKLAVVLERVERLQEEEDEERRDYEESTAEPEEWHREPYGWTWLERWLSPALGAAAWGLFTAHEPWGASLTLHLLWVSYFTHVIAFDLKHRLILNRVTYPAAAAALVLSVVTPGLGLLRSLTGALAVSGFFLAQSVISRGRIGLGDAKLGVVVGAITGLAIDGSQLRALYAVTYAVFLGGGTALLLLVTRVRGLKDPIPYGPFLCVGAALILYQAPA